ncbi:hypothetical protein SHIRM173S_03803 [Streptomyces hirsutus]
MFDYGGIGSFIRTAIDGRDYPVLVGLIMFIAMVYVLINLLVDVASASSTRECGCTSVSVATKTEKIQRLAELTATEETSTGASLWREAFRRLRRSKMAIIGAAVIALFVLVAIVGPYLTPYAPTAQTWRGEVFPNRGEFVGPRGENWFGLDHLGRDLFSRMLVGARQTLLVGVVATLIGLIIGFLIGGLSGAAATLGGDTGRRIDSVIMRFIDMMLAMPSLLLAVSIAAVMGESLTTVMIAVGVVQIPVFARLLRGSMLAQGGADYVLAAKSLGVRKRRIVVSQIIPNSLSPVMVQATFPMTSRSSGASPT